MYCKSSQLVNIYQTLRETLIRHNLTLDCVHYKTQKELMENKNDNFFGEAYNSVPEKCICNKKNRLKILKN